jgi:oligopeptide/dipeptide ABC transporter ATP-binding protein
MIDDGVLLRVENLRICFVSRKGEGLAVNGISFEVHQGETLGLVGESGSGKSVTAAAIVGLLPSGSEMSGSIWFRGEDLAGKTQEEMRKYRGNHISMVLQDPLTALHPLLRIRRQLAEPLKLHCGLRGKALHERIVELMQLMRIPKPEERLNSYPHQFSGGMRQRVVSAIALAGGPELLIADEPTTALDVTIQAAYLSLLKDIQKNSNFGILFISHDLGVIAEVCDRVAVMYSGRIVELGTVDRVLAAPSHPYTKALLEAIPDVRYESERLASIEGSPPSIYSPPSGCRFHPRCWIYEQLGRPSRCQTEEPPLIESDGAAAACHFRAEAAANSPSHM